MDEMSREMALDFLGWPATYRVFKRGTLCATESKAIQYGDEEILRAIRHKFTVEKII